MSSTRFTGALPKGFLGSGSAELGAEGMKDMGKVMGVVSKELAGRADGKTISNIVRAKLA